MFTFISAQVIPKGNAGGWQKKNLNYTRMDFINRDHQVCILELQNEETLERGYVNFFDFPITARMLPIPLYQYLLKNDDIILTIIKDDFSAGESYVKSYLGSAMGITTRGANRNLSTEDELLPDQQIDLLIEHPEMREVDYRRVQEYGLITVAGLLHYTDTREGGLIVYDGAKAAWGYGEDRIGILDFYQVGKLTKKKITPDMLRYPLGKEDMYHTLYIDTGVSLSDKKAFISLAGILYPSEQFVQVIEDTVIKVNLHQIDMVGLFYETRHLIDYSEFPLRRDGYIDDLFVNEDFTKPEFILAMLALSQTFLIFLDGKDITVSKRKLHNHHIPGVYTSSALRDYDIPVIIGRGYLPGYNIHRMIDFDVYSIPNFIVKRPLRRTAVDFPKQHIRDTNYGYLDHDYAEAYHLLIKREVDDD